MASDSESISSILEKARQSLEGEYKISRSKIQAVPPYIKEGDKYARYYRPKLISIGPIHHNDPKLKRGEQYKRMWALMFAEQYRQKPEDLHRKVLDKIVDLREFFSWDEIGKHYGDEDLAFMLFVDGCSILQILERGNLSRPEELKVKVDQLVLVQGDLLLLENQLPYEVLKLLVVDDDDMKLKISMRAFCELQNMFTLLDSQYIPFSIEPERQLQMLERSSPPIHLLDCLRTAILSDGVHTDQQAHTETQNEETMRRLKAHAEAIGAYYMSVMEYSREPVRAINYLTVAYSYAHRNNNEKQTTYRTIQELKAAAIGMKRQKNVSLRNISFSSSLFGGQLHLPPLILDDSTVPTLLNLVAYEMCPDFINSFEISSYVKLLDLLIDHQEDVKELRRSWYTAELSRER